MQRIVGCLILFVTLLAFAARAKADEQELGWTDAAELTYVAASGNAESSTFGFRNNLKWTWKKADLEIDVGLLRAQSGLITRNVVGDSPSSFDVTRTSVSTKTAERYHTRGQFNRQMSARTFWYVGSGWERNTFAGFNNRTSLVGGTGNTWVDDDGRAFRTTYGVSFTFQEDVVMFPSTDDSFVGVRFSYDYRLQLTPTTEVTSVWVADQNLEDADDFRSDFVNAVSVSMTDRLALKLSWQLLYDRQPALVGLPLISPSGIATGDIVPVPLDAIDNLLSFALVATF